MERLSWQKGRAEAARSYSRSPAPSQPLWQAARSADITNPRRPMEFFELVFLFSVAFVLPITIIKMSLDYKKAKVQARSGGGEGVTAGEIQYPVPDRLLASGLMNYIYEGEYANLVDIRVPASVAPGTHSTTARGSDRIAHTADGAAESGSVRASRGGWCLRPSPACSLSCGLAMRQ